MKKDTWSKRKKILNFLNLKKMILKISKKKWNNLNRSIKNLLKIKKKNIKNYLNKKKTNTKNYKNLHFPRSQNTIKKEKN